MKSFIKFCIDNNRATVISLLMIIMFGYQAYVNMPRESFPDVQVPFIFVSTGLDGISPADSERLLVKPMEDILRSIEGIKEISSFAVDGRAYVTLEFPASYKISKALYDVRSKIDDLRNKLPNNARYPSVEEINVGAMPILNVGLQGDLPEHALTEIAKKLRDAIESLPNVLRVDIAGLRKEQVNVNITPSVLQRYNLSIDQVVVAVMRSNRVIAAGSFNSDTGNYAVNITGVLSDIENIMNIPLGSNGNSIVHLRDVAEVRGSFEDVNGFARMNGVPCLVLEVSKRSGKNIIETINQVRNIIDSSKGALPNNLSIIYSKDMSNNIKDMLNDLENNILFSMILVLVMMVAFMGIRSSLLVSMAIPGSFLIGILILKYIGITLNIVVLFSLILSVGMLVDSAIVICEYADRQMLLGCDKKEAFKRASFHMLWPIFTSTLTTLVVFLPLLFWPGLVGQFMRFLPITLIATLSGSFIMAIIFIPLLGSIWGKPSSKRERDMRMAQDLSEGKVDSNNKLMFLYSKILRKAINHPRKSIASMMFIFLITIVVYSNFGKGVEFFPKVEPENASVLVRSNNGNMSVFEKDRLLKEIEEKILGLDDEIRVFYSRVGVFGKSDNSPSDTIGKIHLEFTDWKNRRKADDIIAEIQEKLLDVRGLKIEISAEKKGPSSGQPVNLTLLSYSKEALHKAANQIMHGLNEAGGLININDGSNIPELEWKVDIDSDRASVLGVNVASLGDFIKLMTNGVLLTKYRPDHSNDEIDIVLRFEDSYRKITELEKLFITSNNGVVPISNIVNISLQPRVSKITRVDGMNSITISADVEKGVLVDDKIKFMQEWLVKNPLEDGVFLKVKGEAADQKETGEFLGGAFLIALLAMLLILTFQFNSVFNTFVIMTSVFLCVPGVLIGLLITGKSFGVVMCGVGLIALSGIVVNNNILLIDAYRENRGLGLDKFDAVFRAAIVRSRPIMLTAGTTVLGLLPMITRIGIDFFDREIFYNAPSSQWWVQLSVTIASGLTFATMLTLLLTPCLLILGRDKSSYAQPVAEIITYQNGN